MGKQAAVQEKPPKRNPSPEEIAVEKSPVKTYVFRNLEQPGVCLRCNYGPKFKVEVDDGQIVDLPTCVAYRINGLETPRYGLDNVLDPQTSRPTGEKRHVKLPVGNKRFSLMEVKPPEDAAVALDGHSVDQGKTEEKTND